MLIKDLPEDIRKIATNNTIHYRVYTNNPLELDIITAVLDTVVVNAFQFSATPEGDIWYDVNNNSFDTFYEFHKTNNKNNLLNFNQY